MVAFHSVAFLIQKKDAEYCPETGKYEAVKSLPVLKSCYVYDLSSKYKLLLYGRTNVRALVVYHLGTLVPDTREIEIAKGLFKGRYAIDDRRQLTEKATYVVSEVKRDEF